VHYNSNAKPKLRACVISSNTAGAKGGGVYGED